MITGDDLKKKISKENLKRVRDFESSFIRLVVLPKCKNKITDLINYTKKYKINIT